MKKQRKVGSWLPAILVTVLGCGVTCIAMFRFIGLGIVGLGLVLAIYRLLDLLAARKPGAARILGCIFSCCLGAFLLTILATEALIIYAALSKGEQERPYLIVLGAGVNGTEPSLSLRTRLNAAYEYLTAHPDTVCVVSGGKGDREQISEAECMYRFLTERGIAPERIIKEDRSTSTAENLDFSKELIQQHAGEKVTQVAILSSEYHLYRAKLMAKDRGLDPVMVPANTPLRHLQINYFVREAPALWYYLVFGG